MNPSDPASRDLRIFAFDRRGRLAWFSGPTGGTTRFEYDGDSRKVRIIDPEGREHELAWDTQRTLVETRNSETGEYTFSYDERRPASEKISYDSPWESTRPRITTYTYDADDQLIRSPGDPSEQARS